MRVLIFLGKSECDVINEVLKIRDTNISHNGFGSSDCKKCSSHLISLPNCFSYNLIKTRFSYINK